MRYIGAPGDRLHCQRHYQPVAIKGLLFTGSRHAYSDSCQVSRSDSNDTAAAGPTGCSGTPFTHRALCAHLHGLNIDPSVCMSMLLRAQMCMTHRILNDWKQHFCPEMKSVSQHFWLAVKCLWTWNRNDVQHIRDVSGFVLHTKEIWIIQNNTDAMIQHVKLHSGIFGNDRCWWEWLWQLFNLFN